MRASFGKRFKYVVDNFLARGSSALFVALTIGFLGSFAVLILMRLIIHLIHPDIETDFMTQIYIIFLEMTDPGNMNLDIDTPSIFKIGGVSAGITGVVIFSALIAFLTTTLDQAIATLKKGHSQVLESDHTLILGWSARVVEVLRELVEANESERRPSVVILADRDKEEMDEFLNLNFTDRRNTRIVTRSGAPASLPSLKRVNAYAAKSAIVLATCNPADPREEKLVSDAIVIKTVLALEAQADGDSEQNIVAEIFEPRNRKVVREVAPGRVSVVDAEEILAKIMVQTSRTSGLSVVYAELLSFEGCEMYFYDADWNGISFFDAVFHFGDGVPIGVRRADGTLLIRPPADTTLEDGDEILIVAEDDSTIDFESAPVFARKEIATPNLRARQQQERLLILGWSPKAFIVVDEYADYVLEGSAVDIVMPSPTEGMREEIARLRQKCENLKIELVEKDPLDSEQLSACNPFTYDTLMILPQKPGEEIDAERVDSETIMVLIHLRQLARTARAEGVEIYSKIITEVLDSANQDLISQTGVNDFIISNRMVSMIFAQLSEEPKILQVYDDLFEEDGSEIYVKPASLYFENLPVTVQFGDLICAAQTRDREICIGYKLGALEHDGGENYGIKLIPPKDSTVTINTGDSLVVVAEDER